jgi:hypothetical protein
LEVTNRLPTGSEGYKLEKCVGKKLQVRHGDRVVISGYPASMSQLFPGSQPKMMDVGRMPVQLDTVALFEDQPSRWSDGFVEGKHITLFFDPKQNKSVGLDRAYGFSGSGVWQFETTHDGSSDLWVPFPQLLGIQVSWLEQQDRLKVVLVSQLIRLLHTMR